MYQNVSGDSLVGGLGLLRNRLSDWGYLEQTNGRVRDAVVLYQKRYANEIDRFSRRILGSAGEVDGRICPATAAVMNARNCGVSDFPEHEVRWPDDCKDDLTVSWDFDVFPGTSSAQTELAFRGLETFSNLFDLSFGFPEGAFPNTRITASLRALPGPTLATSFLPNGSCTFRVRQQYDSTVNWSSKKLLWSVLRHEVGHALGLQHTPGDPESLMYPSSRGQFDLNDTDIAQMIRIGYVRRKDVPLPPEVPEVSAVVRVGREIYSLVQEGRGEDGWWP